MSAHKKKLPSGKEVWVAQFRYTNFDDEVIQKKKQGFRTKREALEYERNFLDKMSGKCDMLFSSLVENYYEDMELDLRQTTIENKKYLIDSKILPYFKNKKLIDITTPDINKWHSILKKEGYKPTYLRSIRNQMSAIFNYAISNYNHDKNPVRKAKKMGEKNATEMDFYTIDEFNLFIKSFEDNPTLTIIFKILFYSGIRLGELLALKPNDFDWKESRLRVDENLQRVNGKKVLQKPKTKQSERNISIPEKLADEIKEYLSSIRNLKKNDLIFTVSKSHLGMSMTRGAESAGIRRIRIHDLRHSAASLQIEMGISSILIAERLGHFSTKMLYETYGHLYPTKDKEVGNALNELYL